MSREIVLRVTDLEKLYPVKKTSHGAQTFTALNKVNFALHSGEILGVLGPNGAGKTTLIQILLSVLKPTSGKVEYFGKDFFTHRATIMERISYASGYAKLPAQLTVRENLDIYAQLYGISKKERDDSIEKYLKFFGMWNLAEKESGVLSAGQTTRVMLAKAFITRPRIILLDEPTASLDPDIAHEIRIFILERQKQQDISILVTSHNMDEVTQICNRVLVLKNGEIVANDTPRNLALSVARSRIEIVPDDKDSLVGILQRNRIKYSLDNGFVTIEVEENEIAQFLMHLAEHTIRYSHIAIYKSTLEDYFLSVVRKKP